MTDTIEFLAETRTNSEERWKQDHERAEQCAKLEDLVQLGIDLYSVCRGADDLWSRRVQSGELSFDAEVARAIHEFYQWWIRPCPRVFARIAQFEEEGYEVRGANELRGAYRTAKSLLRQSVEDLVRGFEELAKQR